MPSSDKPAFSLRRLQLVARPLALVIIAVGFVVLLRWVFDSEVSVAGAPKLVRMKANTAISFICLGLALLGLLRRSADCRAYDTWERVIILSLASVPLLVGLVTCMEYIFGLNFHIDELLFKDLTVGNGNYFPGRMSPLTAFNFCCDAIAVILISTKKWVRCAQAFVICASATSMVGLVGYAYDVKSLYAGGYYTAIALHTCLGFILFSIGGLCATGHKGVMNVFTRAGTAGMMARRLLPISIVIPFTLGLLALWIRHQGYGTPDSCVAVLTVANISVLSSAIWWLVRFLRRFEMVKQNAEDATRTSLQRYTFLSDVIPQIVWTCMPDGSLVYCNRRWLEYTGLNMDQAKGWGWTDSVHPDDLKNCVSRWKHCLSVGEAFEVEYRIRRWDGAYRWHLRRALPLRDEQGEIQEWFGTCTDIDDQKHLTKELERSRDELNIRVQERTSQLAEANAWQRGMLASTAFSIISTTPDGIIRTFNRAAESMLGYAADEVIGKQTPAIIHDPNEVAARAAVLSDALGHPVEPGFETFVAKAAMGVPDKNEWTYIRKDGGRFPVELTVTALHGEDGELLGFLGIAQDITERKRVESELRFSRERATTTFEYAAIGMAIVDLDGRWLETNQALSELVGYSQEELITGTFLDITHPDDLEADLGYFRRSLNGELNRYHVEKRYIHKDGSVVWISLNVSLVRDALNQPMHFISQIQGINERKRFEWELNHAKDNAEAANRAKSEFLANMSHEIRTPMNGVIGLSGLLLGTPLNPQQRDYVSAINQSSESLLTIINDILDFSKIEARKLTLENNAFDLLCSVEGALEIVAERASAKSIELVQFVHPDVPHALTGDSGRLRQVLTNLVSNAVKFTSEGEVVIFVSKKAETDTDVLLRFEVRDTGIGIADEAQGRLFQAFSQADGSTTRKFGGTGLGLAIAKQLVSLMGGDLGVVSQPDCGATFWFTARFEKQHEAAISLEAAPSVDTLSGRRVLIVDDNASSRQTLELNVRSWGMLAIGVSNSVEALRTLREAEEPFDLAIVDRQMPVMGGIALAQEVKRESWGENLRIVLLTSAGEAPSGDEDQIVDEWLPKPVKQSRLYDCLSRAITRSRHEKEPELAVSEGPNDNNAPAVIQRSPRSRILLADDNSINQIVTMAQLKKLGTTADLAGNGLEVLEALKRTNYDVILMDCQMPEMDGYEATRRIRSAGRGSHQPYIIAMTAHAMMGDRDKCFAAGMDDYITKPVDMTQFAAALDKALLTTVPVAAEEPTVKQREENLPVNRQDLDRLKSISGGSAAFLGKLFDTYQRDTTSRIASMKNALIAGESKTICREAHSLKGSSQNIGARKMAEVCLNLEASENNLLPERIAALIEQLDGEFERVKIQLVEERAK